MVEKAIERAVRARARERCEYCLLPQRAIRLRFHVDHIVARQHLGGDELNNLALACIFCNLHKGPNISGVDPETRAVSTLFNPREHRWSEHFRLAGNLIEGLTPMGRATVLVLAMNSARQLRLRDTLINEGVYPPTLES